MWGRMWGACGPHVGTDPGRMSPGGRRKREKKMLIDIIDKLVNELYYSDRVIPFYTLACIAFWYVVFLALFDIMGLLCEVWRDYIKPVLNKVIRRLILWVYLRYLDLSDRVRFYQDKKGVEDKTTEIEDQSKRPGK